MAASNSHITPTLFNLPREIRAMIYQHLFHVPGGLPLLAGTLVQGNMPPKNGVVRDMQTFHLNQLQLDEALATYRALRQVNSQLAEEALQDFISCNNITIRADLRNPPIHVIKNYAVPFKFLVQFQTINLVAPRHAGYWPTIADLGGPHLHVLIKTKRRSNFAGDPGLREVMDGTALSRDWGANTLAMSVSGHQGRGLSGDLLTAYILVLERFATYL
ncbi:uncharacterized protein RCC_08876 [Ramularia collo-cygni]|uniref:Uncharacterized protein n=1 Tax=Ramularia collo-cygni TaxID=112498 RepID=A0A2D3V197_9PEZI|nr:uncharacterized protein RCC_08876 [Ramularia collo-cygni]CZT23166.1 uncharacterized protein RCC_08876 [Ramularia collo-cygni]